MKHLYISFLLFFPGFALLAQTPLVELQVGERYDYLHLATMEGEVYSFDELEDSIVVMNFWNIGCRGCLLEQPYLNEMKNHFQNDQIAFWSVTLNEQYRMTEYLEKHPIDWNIKGGVDFMGIRGDSSIQIRVMPTTIIFDKNRIVQYKFSGPILNGPNGLQFEETLTNLLPLD